jgi:hypothetical protein
MNRLERDSLHGLLSAVVDDSATAAQVAELARLLAADPEARRFYVRYVDMHAALAGGQLPEFSRRASRLPWIAVVATLMAASLLGAWLVMSPGQPEGRRVVGEAQDSELGSVTTAGYVATIVSASSNSIVNGDVVREGARLAAGHCTVDAGAVSVQFDGGAEILFDGGSRFTIQSRRAIAIDRATFVFRGDQTCESIEITTPHSALKNLGTRYAVVVDADGEEVHVAEGAVRRTQAGREDAAGRELIEAGAGRRYTADAAEAESIPLDRSLASRSLDEAPTAHEPQTDPKRSRALTVDDFRHETGQIHGLKSGSGWAGEWESRRGDLSVESPGLAGEGSSALVHDGTGKRTSESGAAAHRRFNEAIDLSEDGIWYLRFLFRRGPAGAKNENRIMVVLRSRGLTTQEEIDQNALIQVAIRKDASAILRLGDTLTRASLPLAADQTYAVVAKIVAGRSKPDQVLVSLMAADRLEQSAEPTEWTLVSENVTSDMRLEKLSIEFVGGGRKAVGDLRIGPTWASIAQPLDR